MKVGDCVWVKIMFNEAVAAKCFGQITEIFNAGSFREINIFFVKSSYHNGKIVTFTKNELELIPENEAMLMLLENA